MAVQGGRLIVDLDDGRRVEAPLEWFPRLRGASAADLGAWKLIGGGEGIHWPTLDEDLSVAGLLRGTKPPGEPSTRDRGASSDDEIEAALARLSPRERSILAALFGSSRGTTLAELQRHSGEAAPITPSSLRNLLRKASDGFSAEAG